jgi:hypothetical protein
MYAENNLIFKDVEDCRYVLRYIEGKVTGITNKVKNSEFFMKESRSRNPLQIARIL